MITDLACQVFEERPLELGSTIVATLKRHLWIWLILYVAYVLASGVFGTITESLYVEGTSGVNDIISILVFAVELYVISRIAFVVPSLVSEEMGPIQTLKRSLLLTRHSWMRVLIHLAAFGLLLIGVALILFVIGGIIEASAFTWWMDFLRLPSVTVRSFLAEFPRLANSMIVFLSIPVFLLFPLLQIFSTVFYYDLRTRADGPLAYEDSPTTGEPVPKAPSTKFWKP
jgi:hypothetical protein